VFGQTSLRYELPEKSWIHRKELRKTAEMTTLQDIIP